MYGSIDNTVLASTPPYRDEVLTILEVAALLKMTKRQVYELTRNRGQVRQDHPIPVLKINGNVRFLRSDIDRWLQKLADGGRPQ